MAVPAGDSDRHTIDNPRLRLIIGRHGRRIAVALVGLAVIAFVFTGMVVTGDHTTTVTQQTNNQRVVTASSTSAVVTDNDTLWAEGTRLTDKPLYLLNATPNLTVSASTTVTGTDSATVTHVWNRTIRATGGENDAQFWSNTTTLARTTREGTTVRSNATVDVRSLRRRVAAAQADVESAGVVSVSLSLRVRYETDEYAGSTRASAPLTLRESAYSLDGDLGSRANHSTPVTTEVPRPPDPTRTMGPAAFGVLSLVTAGGIVALRPDSIDLNRAVTELHERRYAQWISHGTIPMWLSENHIELDSLENVVDVAIDTNERVVHDTRSDLYAVFSGDVVYYYSAGGSWGGTAFTGGAGPVGGEDAAAGGPPGGGPPGGGGGFDPSQMPDSDLFDDPEEVPGGVDVTASEDDATGPEGDGDGTPFGWDRTGDGDDGAETGSEGDEVDWGFGAVEDADDGESGEGAGDGRTDGTDGPPTDDR